MAGGAWMAGREPCCAWWFDLESGRGWFGLERAERWWLPAESGPGAVLGLEAVASAGAVWMEESAPQAQAERLRHRDRRVSAASQVRPLLVRQASSRHQPHRRW